MAEGRWRLVRDGLVGHVVVAGWVMPMRPPRSRDGRFETVQAYHNAVNPSAGVRARRAAGRILRGPIGTAAEQAGVIRSGRWRRG
ncbi:MAG: hypothetical protein U0232_08020 [Thermomicrobiales bacterium]